MAENAFARCQRFLNYHAPAKWFSILSSIGTAILYLGLIVLLGLFIDLLVDRGEIPSFYQLSEHERQLFLSENTLPEDNDKRAEHIKSVKAELEKLGFDPIQLRSWEKGESIDKWTAHEKALLWWAKLPDLLAQQAGDDAADTVRKRIRDSNTNRGTDVTEQQPLDNFGILSLVVRTQHSYKDRIVGFFAARNIWMWDWGNDAFLLGMFIAAVSIAIVRLGLLFLSNYLGAVSVLEAVTRLRRAIYMHTTRLGTLAFRALGPSEAVSVSTRHLEAVHDGLYQWLTIYFREPVKFGLLIVFTFVVNFWLAVAILLIATLVWLIGGQIAAYFRSRGRVAEMRSADQLVLIQESLMLMRLIKIYLMEAFNQKRLERQLSSYARAQLLRYRGEAIYRPVFFFLGLLAALVLLFVAAHVILSGQVGVTSCLVLAAAIISLYWPILSFLEARRIVRRSRQSAKVLFGFLDRQGGVGQAIEAEIVPAMTKAIQFDKVSLKEPGTGRKLLTNVSLTIRAGEKVAIVGPDEMEKHALVYLLPRFLDPSHGEIRFDGKNLRWVTLDSLRIQIAMVLQHNLVFNDTVVNNIGCGDPMFNLQRITDAAKLAHAHQFISKLPQGYETVIGDHGHPLKLGEKFRVALARAILRDPAVLVIEETHAPLDDDTKAMVDDTFQRVLPGRTVIFLPHRLTTIRNCDQVFLLYEGKVEATGVHRDLLTESELYRHLQYMEFNEYASLVAPAAPRVEESVSEG
jgi:ATP-binding cassette, subfamily B, bacterial